MNAPRSEIVPIVLTGTIVPNGVPGPLSDPAERRQEYLDAIRFYRQFAPVYFLENSGYPLIDDPDFSEAEDFRVCQLSPSTKPERGKGYQEFEMLDAWIEGEQPVPDRWLKITGRYIVENIEDLLRESTNEKRVLLIIDQLRRSAKARTYLFSVDTTYYRAHLRGLYLRCNDQTGRWIEFVLYEALKSDAEASFRFFAHQPVICARAGSSGQEMRSSGSALLIKRLLRWINRRVNSRYLLYPK